MQLGIVKINVEIQPFPAFPAIGGHRIVAQMEVPLQPLHFHLMIFVGFVEPFKGYPIIPLGHFTLSIF